MSDKNHETIGKALDILKPALSKFVGEKLSYHIGRDNWWKYGVMYKLDEVTKRELPNAGDYDELLKKLNLPVCLKLLAIHKEDYFRRHVPENFFNWLTELSTIRKQWHDGHESFDETTTARALDTMILIADKIDVATADKLRELKGDKPQVQPQPTVQPPQPQPTVQPPQPQPTVQPTLDFLPAWRDVITPNPDVTKGEYNQSEWMASLSEVVFEEKSRPEYLEPVEFFSRTYLTGGLKGLLVEVLKRLTDGNGEPVIQLKTAFGGGKTHSLLALHHLFNGEIQPEQSEAVREVMTAANVATLPKVNKVVFVGTWTNPLKSTFWGEITAQLAHAANKPELDELIRENEERNVPPGVALMKKIFAAASPCLILIDELVAYAKGLDKDQVDKIVTFCQQLTEAVKSSPRTALVVTIPQSKSEVGDNLGKILFSQIEKVFGRVESVWRSVSKDEGYEIVRRRLFGQCDTVKREKVCAAFFKMYCDNENDFPNDTCKSDYKKRLLSCYPIHPKLFDFFYEKWTNLENFQKTRGVLRLMANVVYNLLKKENRSAMIMPCDIPLDAPDVHGELTKTLLKGNWDAVVDSEIDGSSSRSYKLDDMNNRFFNLQPARRISRSIFMGTAPVQNSGELQGLTENEIRLCTIDPSNVKEIAVFNDALSKLRTNLHYLHSQGEKFWFALTPTLRKTVDDKRERYTDKDIFAEMEMRIKSWKVGGQFAAIHFCPKTSADVPDDMTARLVVLSPKNSFDALSAVRDILDNRGTMPRQWKNMLVFIAADGQKVDDMKDDVREYKAWSEVAKEVDDLILRIDNVQAGEMKSTLALATKTFAMRLSQAYRYLIYPESDDSASLQLPLHVEEIDCMSEENLSVATKYFTSNELLASALGGDVLRRQLDKRNFIWQGDAVNVKQLWEYFAKYYYMPRLLNENVLLDAIKRGVSNESFALAADENLSDLQFGETFSGQVKPENFLVKASVAKKLLGTDEEPPEVVPEVETVEEPAPVEQTAKPSPEAESLPKKFRMDVQLDNMRLIKNFNSCARYVLEPLQNLPNVKANIRLVVDMSIPEGVPADIKKIIEGNCVYHGISNATFDD